MTQVSKKKLGIDLENEVYSIFWHTIARITKDKEVDDFFTDLFTRTERVNFTKRLAIAILLYKSYDWDSISDLLKVSLGTVAKISTKINSKGFQLFFKKLEQDANWRKFWEDLAKTYLLITHPDKYARLGDEGVERIYLGKRKKPVLH